MPVILTSIFSAIIIFVTVFFMIKVLSIAYQRKEISILKYRVLATSFIVVSVLIASILPIGYQKIFEIIL
jgi:hypothetical protein